MAEMAAESTSFFTGDFGFWFIAITITMRIKILLFLREEK
jgi:hypothetical protein